MYNFVNPMELPCNGDYDGLTKDKKYTGYIKNGFFETTDDNGVYRQIDMSCFNA